MVFPILAAATLGAGALSAISGNSAAKKAADASRYATDQNNALQREQFAQTQANLSPYMLAGQTGLDTLGQRAGGTGGLYGDLTNPTLARNPYTTPEPFKYTGGDYQESPGLKFAIERGVDAINSAASAKGSLYSGATLKKVGQFVADTQLKDFQNERAFAQNAYTDQRNFGRANYLDDRNYDTGLYQDQRNYLTSGYNTQTGVAQNLATLGANAAGGLATAGQNMANNIGNAYTQNASNQANAGLVASSNFSNLLGQGLNAYAYSQRPGVVGGQTPYYPPNYGSLA